MKRLTLLRHAKAGHKDGSVPDFERPLTCRGKEDAVEMGRRLAARGCAPDAAVTSPARRARKTAQAALRALGTPEGGLREDGRIYDADVETLLEVVRGLDDAWAHVLLVGHNPGFTDLANRLGGLALGNLPTAGAVCLDLPGATWEEAARGPGTPVFVESPQGFPRP